MYKHGIDSILIFVYCRIFTSMIGKKTNIPLVKKELRDHKVMHCTCKYVAIGIGVKDSNTTGEETTNISISEVIMIF